MAKGGDKKNCWETVSLLFNYGAHADETNNYGKTPFNIALQKRNFRVMWELIKGGANINLPINEMNETYLHMVIRQFKPTSLIRFLLDLGADSNCSDIYGLTPIQKAALMGDLELLEVLYDYNANIFVRDRNGYTLLHCAALYGKTNVVSWLLERELDIEAKCNDGKTALYYAALHGHMEVGEILLKAGAKVEFAGDSDLKAIQEAFSNGHMSCVRELLLSSLISPFKD